MLAVPFHIQMRQTLESQRVQVAVQRRTNLRNLKRPRLRPVTLARVCCYVAFSGLLYSSLFHEDFKPVKLGDAALTRNTAGAQQPSAHDDVKKI